MLEEKLSKRVQIFHDNINTDSAISSSTSSSNFENFTVERNELQQFHGGVWVSWWDLGSNIETLEFVSWQIWEGGLGETKGALIF